MNRRTKRRIDDLLGQQEYASQLIARHQDAIDKLNEAKEVLTELNTLVRIRADQTNEDVWTGEMTDHLSRITLQIRDCNWKQYG